MPTTLAHPRFSVVDVETTGLFPSRHDRIIEIAVVVMSPEGIVEREYVTLVNPERDMGPTRIHGIKAGDVLHAPRFADIAGDVIATMCGTSVVAGHNVSFDRLFVSKEFERIGVSLPEFACLCTCALLGRNDLESCCQEFGLPFDGQPHCALNDARMTAKLLHYLMQDDPDILVTYRASPAIPWPALPQASSRPLTRQAAVEHAAEPPHFLRRMATHLRHNSETAPSNVLAYFTLLDRVLEDRRIDDYEADSLVDAAQSLKLTMAQTDEAHRSYLQNLSVRALADGVVTDAERRDLNQVAQLLGLNENAVDEFLTKNARQIESATPPGKGTATEDLRGKSVCFTGELLARVKGEPISREVAEALAEKAGLVIASSVTKKLDLLVVADPNTQSGKAKKARQYGLRILADTVFWPMIGVDVE